MTLIRWTPPKLQVCKCCCALALDVDRRIDIAVMFDMTNRALPDPLTQRHFRHFVTAAMTGFRAGEPLIQFDQMDPRRYGFVFQFHEEAIPARIPDSHP